MKFQFVDEDYDLRAELLFKEGLKETKILTAVSFGEV